MESSVYIAVYNAQREDDSALLNFFVSQGAELTSKLMDIEASWPVDLGDDPSFLSHAAFGGQLTWGICRPNVRNRLQPKDTVVFFSRQEDESKTSYYSLACIAVVESLASHEDIATGRVQGAPTNRLLAPMAPTSSLYEHKEWHSDRNRWHPNWLWLMMNHVGARHGKQALKYEHVEPYCAQPTFNSTTAVGGNPLPWSKNYVFFSCEETFILERPVEVAVAAQHDKNETWHENALADLIWDETLGRSDRDYLRTSNTGFRHVFKQFSMKHTYRWRRNFIKAMKQHGVTRAPWQRTQDSVASTD